MKLYAVIVAGGSGKRMGAEVPKQFLELGGRPLLMHTIERFKSFDSSIEIITVLPEDQIRRWMELQEKYSFKVPQTLVKGGSSRFYSVKNGLEFVESPGLVAIHDGVRPFVSSETIKRCFDTAMRLGNAIPVIPPSDTLRLISDEASSPLNRLHVRLVQTPQVFNADLIREAYKQPFSPDFTDDAIVVEQTGVKINLVEGNRENIKITNPEDMLISNAFLRKS
ncbi:MAG TPA: 2-C-methyl-D-erythritol 4-phosphate cytidylyltransferase [Bacteroidales bacterium]|nr:2-C-methyl-D-erythritol 4-phosphate cytidylyltransferase [Bacteroidales bacterium]